MHLEQTGQKQPAENPQSENPQSGKSQSGKPQSSEQTKPCDEEPEIKKSKPDPLQERLSR